MFDCDDYFSSESDCESWPPSSLYDRLQPSGGYHAVPPPYTGTFMPPKPDLVFNTAPTAVETNHLAFNVSDSEDESKTKATQFVLSFVQSSKQVKSPRHSVQPVETSIPAATPKPASLNSASSGKRRNKKACFVCKSVDHLIKDCDYHAKKIGQPTPRNYAHRGNHKQYASLTHTNSQKHMVPAAVLTQSKPVSITAIRPVSAAMPKIKGNPQHALKDKGVIDSGCSRHMIGNMSYLSDFKKINGEYVAFGGNPKGGKIFGKGKIKTGNLVRGLPIKVFENDNTCVTCKKGKQHRTSSKTKHVSSIDQPLYRLHVDLFGPTFVKSLNKKSYCLVVTDDYSRFTWVFFLATKDETSPILKTFITSLENQLSLKVEAVNIACYVQNRVLVTKPYNKTPYELLHGRTPSIGFMRPFSCHVAFLNTLDPLGKFERNVDEGFLVGYSVSSKAFRVFNSRTRIIQETLHVNFLENKPNVAGSGPTWLFDIYSLTRTMNYQPVTAGNQTNPSAGFQDKFSAEKVGEDVDQQYVLFRVWSSGSTNPQNYDGDAAFDGKEHDSDAKKPEFEVNVSPSSSAQLGKQDDKTKKEDKGKSPVEFFIRYRDLSVEFEDRYDNNNNEVNAAGFIVPTIGKNSLNNTNTFSVAGPSNAAASPTYGKSSFIDASQLPDDPDMPELEDITYSDYDDDVGAEVDFNNLKFSITDEPKRVHQTLKDLSWIEAIQEELLQFKMQKDWVLVDFPHGKRAIGTKWVYRNKKDERGIVIRNKERLVAQGHTQEKGIDYEEVFALVARIEAIRLFLAYASFMGFMVYQMGVNSTFLYATIKEEVYVCQPLGFEDPDHPDKVYKVVKALYGLHQAPRAWYETLANYLIEIFFERGKIDQTLFIKRQKEDILLVQIYVDDIIFGATNKDLCKSFKKLMKDKFQMSSMGELTFFLGLQVKQKKDVIFISQDKYVAKILRMFGLTEGKTASTPIDTKKPLMKDPDGEDVDIHIYRLMIVSLMYLTSSRPDIMFAACACTRFQVTPKASHLHAVKRIFRYLKGKPHLGLWYPKDLPFYLVAYSDSDYCKNQTVVATSSTKAEYVAAASFCAQMLWIQNQLLDYGEGFNQIIDFLNESYIKYALTVNSNIYVSCIKQFWNIVAIKQVNDVTRLQTLVDKKKVVITEAAIREVLHLDDAEGAHSCLTKRFLQSWLE
nr:putative ribonuclease H-like domain-containing protein [Tanacetum cinerariifolium]